METLNLMGLKKLAGELMHLVIAVTTETAPKEGAPRAGFDPKNTEFIVEKFRQSFTQFNDLTNATTCTTYDQMLRN